MRKPNFPRKLLLVCSVLALFVFAACSKGPPDATVVPTAVPVESVVASESQFCVPIEREKLDFAVLNDVRALLELKSVFQDTAQDPELLLLALCRKSV